MLRSDQRITYYYNYRHTGIELQATAARGLDCCCWGGRIVAWCSVQKEGKKGDPLLEQKSLVCILIRAFAGIRDAETQSQRGCCGNSGICLKCA